MNHGITIGGKKCLNEHQYISARLTPRSAGKARYRDRRRAVKFALVLTIAAAIAAVGINMLISDKELKIPISEISENAKWYEFKSDSVTIRFFVVKADDGSIKVAFDACDICYKYGKGYRQEGSYMVCNFCGNRFLIKDLGTRNKDSGGCWPIHLPSRIDGMHLVIKISDLEKEKWRFKNQS